MRYNIEFTKSFATKKKGDKMKNVDSVLCRHLVNLKVATIVEKVSKKAEKVTEPVGAKDDLNKPGLEKKVTKAKE